MQYELIECCSFNQVLELLTKLLITVINEKNQRPFSKIFLS